VPLSGYENSDSGEETPVPALFLGRGCSSIPSSRLGPGASTRGPSTGPSAGSGLSAQDFQHFRNPFDRLRTWQLFWQPVYPPARTYSFVTDGVESRMRKRRNGNYRKNGTEQTDHIIRTGLASTLRAKAPDSSGTSPQFIHADRIIR